jgi:DNA-binding NtrC family response regulator
LKNAVERALLLSGTGQLDPDELVSPASPPAPPVGPIPFPAALHEITAAAARATVKLCRGNRTESARRLLISPRRLRRLLNGHGDAGWGLDEDDLAEVTAQPIQ